MRGKYKMHIINNVIKLEIELDAKKKILMFKLLYDQ